MNKFKITLIASSVAAALAGLAMPAVYADDAAPAVSLTGSAAVVSDYRFRGISQTYKKPAVQVGINLGLPAGFYAGFWGSNVSTNVYNSLDNGMSMETDWFGGYVYKVNPDLSFDVGGLYYFYPGSSIVSSGVDTGTKYNTFELHAAATYKWLTAKYNVTTNNFFGATDSKGSTYLQLDAAYPLTDTVTLNAHAGHQWVKGTGNSQLNYTDWLLGATYTLPAGTFAPGWAVSLAYVDTNAKQSAYTYTGGTGSKYLGGPTAVLSLSKSF
ncbi:MAG: TorF family putative porin [Halothiobacillus sp.]